MSLPAEPVTLSVEQIRELNQKLADLRHDINNHVSVMLASTELLQRRPETAERLLAALAEQPQKIIGASSKFSSDLETAFHITRP